jgi:hypothetical protein
MRGKLLFWEGLDRVGRLGDAVASKIVRLFVARHLFTSLKGTSMNLKLIFAGLLFICAGAASAANFEGKQFSFGTIVSVGTLLDCEVPDAPLIKRLSPKTFDWVVSQGLAENSAVTGTASYTAKVTTKNSNGTRALIIGCWVATEIIQETINGKVSTFAKGSFKINDVIRSSPLVSLSVCKKKKEGSPLYTQGDFRIVYEETQDCQTNNWQEKITPLAEMEKETALFELRQSMDKKGYIRNVGW